MQSPYSASAPALQESEAEKVGDHVRSWTDDCQRNLDDYLRRRELEDDLTPDDLEHLESHLKNRETVQSAYEAQSVIPRLIAIWNASLERRKAKEEARDLEIWEARRAFVEAKAAAQAVARREKDKLDMRKRRGFKKAINPPADARRRELMALAKAEYEARHRALEAAVSEPKLDKHLTKIKRDFGFYALVWAIEQSLKIKLGRDPTRRELARATENDYATEFGVPCGITHKTVGRALIQIKKLEDRGIWKPFKLPE